MILLSFYVKTRNRGMHITRLLIYLFFCFFCVCVLILINLSFYLFIYQRVCFRCKLGAQDAGVCTELRMFVGMSEMCRCRWVRKCLC